MIEWEKLSKDQKAKALQRPAIANNANLVMSVSNILEQVKSGGDQALYDLTLQFDGVDLSKLAISAEQINAAEASLTEKRKEALHTAYQQISCFHQAQVAATQDIHVETKPGIHCTLKTEPIAKVGLYIPAGTAPLPSTVLMLGVPAQIANCTRRVLVCPPNKQGELAPEVLVAAKLCGITEIYSVGGAQAIAALAYGTETIPAVNKVFGPGNRFVTEAKKQLAQNIPGFAIDMPAGPSELLIIADETATAEFTAADLLSQAEHGPDSQVILLSDSVSLINQVTKELEKQLQHLSRRDIAQKSLQHAQLIMTKSIAQAVEISNNYAPEHLIIQTLNPNELLAQLHNAGSIFVGHYTPESAGDYASGTNHVLPTYGYSKVVSSLSLSDFSRRYTVQEISKEGLASIAECLVELTDAEGLDAHKRAVTIRLGSEVRGVDE